MSSPVALITGVTGQDGSYLTEFLLSKGYIVHGLIRKASTFNTSRIDHLIQDHHLNGVRFFFHYGDLCDMSSLLQVLKKVHPDEVYNLAAQTHVRYSFDHPITTAETAGLGTIRLLEAIRILGWENTTRFYQASTSELFGDCTANTQNEDTPFNPCSPYAISKLFAHYSVINYRNAYGMFACAGVLFNHESPRRGETFVTRKITMGVASIHCGLSDCIYLGNLEARRDWGHARDYVEVMWLLLQQDTPRDYVIATGRTHTVRYFVEAAFRVLDITLQWEGEGVEEIGRRTDTGAIVVRIDPSYFRPTEVPHLCGDASRAQQDLGWRPQITLESMIEEMVQNDLRVMTRKARLLEEERP